MNSTKRSRISADIRDAESVAMEWLGGEAFVAGFPSPSATLQSCPSARDPSRSEEAAPDWLVL